MPETTDTRLKIHVIQLQHKDTGHEIELSVNDDYLAAEQEPLEFLKQAYGNPLSFLLSGGFTEAVAGAHEYAQNPQLCASVTEGESLFTYDLADFSMNIADVGDMDIVALIVLHDGTRILMNGCDVCIANKNSPSQLKLYTD
jgi:hypothetical protein